MVLAPFQPIVSAVPKPLRSTTTFYSPWVYAPNGVTSTLNFVQGIGEGTRKNTYTIVGTYGQLNNGALGVVYQGVINSTNTTQETFSLPGHQHLRCTQQRRWEV